MNVQEIIEAYAKGDAKSVAVANFLGSLDFTDPDWYTHAVLNLGCDQRLYAWNTATVSAIMHGINLIAERMEDDDCVNVPGYRGRF